MPLPKPSLDNRTFDQLVAEARGQIPRLAPDWTDHNASDPGITLIELCAWLAEQNIYRFDRASDEALRAFVRLVGIEPQPPGVARTVVSIDNGSGTGLALPARIQLASASTELYETTAPVFASPATLSTVATVAVAREDRTADNAALRAFYPFGERPRRNHALTLGFDRALDAAGETIALHVWTDTWMKDRETRSRLIDEFAAMVDRVKLDCSCASWKAAQAGADWMRHYRVATVWEYQAAGGWQPLRDVVDETRALSLTGFVRFSAPTGHQPAGGGDSRFYLRCRILRGRFECPPRLRHIGINAVEAEHALSRAERIVGGARGHALATFALGEAPIVAGQTQIRLDNGAGDVQADWREVDDFDRSGAHDRHYRVDPELGRIEAGDGLRGEVPPAGYAVLARHRAGGGESGNVDAGTLSQVPANAVNVLLAPALASLGTPLAVAQPFRAQGGSARETLRAAQARAFAAVHDLDKAVTLDDFERLARRTPGVPVARVHAVAGMHPALPCYPASGVVTLIVVPSCRLPAPMPSRAFLDAVARYLDSRRLVTSEVHVIAPTYRRIAVHATLHLECDVDAQAVRSRAIARLDALFDPLSGGPDATGWTIGRTVYRSEILAVLAELPGVHRVTDLGLRGPGDESPRCGNVELCPYELAAAGRHRIAVLPYHPASLARSDAHECQPC